MTCSFEENVSFPMDDKLSYRLTNINRKIHGTDFCGAPIYRNAIHDAKNPNLKN